MILAAITTHKRPPEMVERALKSVIAQTYTDWNLVVVDDSPADWELRGDVRKMVEGYAEKDSRIRYVAHERNYGAQRARNTALGIAVNEGFEFIAYLDDDDEWLPEKLERQLEVFMGRGKDTALVYSRSYVAEHDGKIIGCEFERGGEKRTFAEG
ncbi:MAG: glycosyltransferase family 2 protein, partial [Synergistaceae bacterium]|nr:glycosyltransferase family 2 protein [Synergistaceae bacterium]